MPIAKRVFAPPFGPLLPCQGYQGPCEGGGAWTQRQMTAYVNDEQNWVTLCAECAAANESNWEYMWREYNASRL